MFNIKNIDFGSSENKELAQKKLDTFIKAIKANNEFNKKTFKLNEKMEDVLRISAAIKAMDNEHSCIEEINDLTISSKLIRLGFILYNAIESNDVKFFSDCKRYFKNKQKSKHSRTVAKIYFTSKVSAAPLRDCEIIAKASIGLPPQERPAIKKALARLKKEYKL